MELHAITDEWCEAAELTAKLMQMVLDGEVGPPRRTWPRGNLDFGDPEVMSTRRFTNLMTVVRHRLHIEQQLTPKVPLVKRLTPEQRRRAARRNLRNMMRVYCPELLSDFENATARRYEWVKANASAIMEALITQPDDLDSLRTWAEEARQCVCGGGGGIRSGGAATSSKPGSCSLGGCWPS
ncbi:hypothetical protein [Streptomyces shaanxiensis]